MSTPTATDILARDLQRQSENATYTAAAQYLWMHALRLVRGLLIAAQVILFAVASWQFLKENEPTLAAILALLANIPAALLKGFNIGDTLRSTKAAAAEWSAIRDDSRRAAELGPTMLPGDFAAEAKALFQRADAARREQSDAPHLFFLLTRGAVAKGTYKHEVDRL